jgi:hypothetical protein
MRGALTFGRAVPILMISSALACSTASPAGSSKSEPGAGTGGTGSAGTGATGAAGSGSSGTAGNGATGGAGSGSTGIAGACGMMMPGMMKGPMGGKMCPGVMMGAAGSPPVVSCTPGVQGTLITGCGYPGSSGGTLASVEFNEDEVLRAIQPVGGAPNGIVRAFYNDEHAMTLGVRSVVVKTASGSTTTDYPVSALMSDPGSVTNAQLGTTELAGDQSGLDQSLRPMWPALFITDITANPQNRSGDWQQGGRPIGPTEVFGTWKAAVRTVDKTVTPNAVTITPDQDPAKNSWSLGGGDAVPAGLANEGYGAEARWSVSLLASHSYRVQVIVHDGDQNKAGGDSGEACVLFCSGSSTGAGGSGGGAGGEGGGAPPAACPTGVDACGGDGIDPANCPQGTVCANGCCLTSNIIP